MINNLVVYNSAKCNLNCRYCFISKNNKLDIVDKKLASILENPQYYIEQLAKINVSLNDIKQLSIWGAEPLLNIERVFPILQTLIENQESKIFSQIEFSTNCAHDKINSGTENLMQFLAKYPYRNFSIFYQISIDGPESITDLTRGLGTTQKIINNFNKLIENNFYITTNNITVYISFKATVDKDYIDYFLTRDNIIKYYNFFEDNFIKKIHNTNQLKLIGYPTPNFAIPNNYSQEDGIKLKKIFIMLKQLEEDNKNYHLFKYYNNLMWLKRYNLSVSNFNEDYHFCGGFCGAIINMIGILPEGYYCGCHRNFANFCEIYNQDYLNGIRKDSSISKSQNYSYNPFIFSTSDEFLQYQQAMSQFYNKNCTSLVLISNLVIQIRYLAKCNQIDSKYLDEKRALQAAKTLITFIPYCATANIEETGCFQIVYSGWLRLMLNGALDILSE